MLRTCRQSREEDWIGLVDIVQFPFPAASSQTTTVEAIHCRVDLFGLGPLLSLLLWDLCCVHRWNAAASLAPRLRS